MGRAVASREGFFMRVRFLGLWLPLMFACSGTNVVAGPERTEAERLEALLPTWCDDMCSVLRSCTDADCGCEAEGCSCSIDEECAGQCRAELTAIARTSAACAATAGRMQRCYDAQGCAVLGNERACREFEDEAEDCNHADYDSGSTSPPEQAYGTAGSASYGTAGSVSAGAPSVGPTSGGPIVTCQGGVGGGPISPEPGITGVICEEGRFDCSDGSDYSMVCVATSTGQRACSCLVDAVVTGAFAPGQACPTSAEMNAGCGWRLAEL